MPSTPRALGLYGAVLSAGLLALPACNSGSDSDLDVDPVTADPAVGGAATDGAGGDLGGLGKGEDPGDGEESLDADGYLGDSTSAGEAAGAGSGGDEPGEE